MATESVGEIYKVKNGNAIIIAPVSPYLLEKQKINKCLVRFDDGRTINAEQRKKAYAILSDITEFTGNLPEYEKELQKYFYIARTGAEYFSLSDCTVSEAREFISYLIDFCFENKGFSKAYNSYDFKVKLVSNEGEEYPVFDKAGLNLNWLSESIKTESVVIDLKNVPSGEYTLCVGMFEGETPVKFGFKKECLTTDGYYEIDSVVVK